MSGFGQSTNLEHSTTNDTRLAEFMASVREMGRDEASGKDALPKLAVAFVRAVADGVLEMNKDSDGNDGAARVYYDYVKSKTKRQIHDRSDAGLKANISKLRQIGVFAGNPKWDAVEVFNKTFTIRADHEKDDIAVKPAYAAFVDVAREQLKQDDQLTDAQIGATVMATSKTKEVTLEGQLQKAYKILEEIVTGENKHGIKDSSSEVIQAAENLQVRLAALGLAKQTAEDEKTLEEIAARRAA
jgi:hypothetical protein